MQEITGKPEGIDVSSAARHDFCEAHVARSHEHEDVGVGPAEPLEGEGEVAVRQWPEEVAVICPEELLYPNDISSNLSFCCFFLWMVCGVWCVVHTVECPLECGITGLWAEELEPHLSSTCPRRIVRSTPC